jgi:hypothetical protein
MGLRCDGGGESQLRSQAGGDLANLNRYACHRVNSFRAEIATRARVEKTPVGVRSS